eukprot:16007122-Heterocapsa_arctica.AAC.1
MIQCGPDDTVDDVTMIIARRDHLLLERNGHSLYHNLYLMGEGRKLDPTLNLTQEGIGDHATLYVTIRDAIRGVGTEGSPTRRRKDKPEKD